MSKVLYIEISTAHTEILTSFIEALQPENEVHLLINEKSKKRVNHLQNKIRISYLNEESAISEILRYKKMIKPDLILLNSAQGRKIRDLCLLLFFDRTPIVGIHHNAENIYTSFTQKIIHFKIKKYIVLADFIKDFLQTRIKPGLLIESFYPLSYYQEKTIKLDSQKYISIPGVLEQDRRDYLGLVEIVKKYHEKLDPQLQFVLLGNSKNHDGPTIVQKINEAELQSRFILFDRYVEDEVLLSYVQNSLAVMPLLHPGTRWFEKYFETKISGAYSLAFAFNKTLLMHDVFKGKKEFENHAVFYNSADFIELLSKISKQVKIQKTEKFSASFQKMKLLQFI
jgi:hypothetical protein